MNKAAAWLLQALARLLPKTPCRRCRGTGLWNGFDCPDCQGSGKV